MQTLQPLPPLDLDCSVLSDPRSELYAGVQRDELLLRPKWLACWEGHVSFIEPSIGSSAGVPDVHLIDHGFDPGWVEFKALDGHGTFKLKPEQRGWMRSYSVFSSRCAVVVMDALGFYTIPMRPFLERDYRRFYSPHDLLPGPLYPYMKWEGLRKAHLIISLREAYA